MGGTVFGKRTFLIALIVALSIGALMGIFIFIFGDFGETEVRLLGTTLALGGYSLTGLCSSILYDKKKILPLAYFGMGVSIIGFIFAVSLIWKIIDYSPFLQARDIQNAFWTLIVVAVASALSSLVLLVHGEKKVVNNIAYFTVGCISIVSFMLIGWMVGGWRVREPFFRVLGVFAILAVSGAVIAPILDKVLSLNK